MEYYSVFEGFTPPLKDVNLPILEAIKKFILSNKNKLKEEIEKNLSNEAISMLHRLAIGDRRIYSALKNEQLSQTECREVYKELFDKKLIILEESREVLPPKNPRFKQKKQLRRYQVQDKLHFSNQFHRFWFAFFSSNLDPSLAMQRVEKYLETHVSLAYEQLSLEFLALYLNEPDVALQGSYWDRKHDIDILVTLKDGRVIAGECKWKSRRVCKNILTILQNKAQYAGLKVDCFVLFSKNGFSKELLRLKSDSVWLFDISYFERFLYD